MRQIKKSYVQPALTVVSIQVEDQLLAASMPASYEEKIYDQEGSGDDALSKSHTAPNFWADSE